MADPALILDRVGHRHGEGPFLFRDLSLRLPFGRVLTVLGPNGRGKTTLLTCLAGLRAPVEGRVTRPRAALAYVPQASRGGLAYRALDMVLMGRAGHLPLLAWPSAKDRAIAAQALSRAGVAHLADRSFATLSGGEKALVLIGRALAAEARLIILDEPFAALDLANQQGVLALLASLVRDEGVALVITTHQPQHALVLKGDALVLDNAFGHVHGAADDILDEALLSRVFRLPVARVDVTRGAARTAGVVPLFGDVVADMSGGAPTSAPVAAA
jgi:iron complex transport system ATP-binding protein